MGGEQRGYARQRKACDYDRSQAPGEGMQYGVQFQSTVFHGVHDTG